MAASPRKKNPSESSSDRQATAILVQPSSPRFPVTSSGAHRKIGIAVDLSDESAFAVKWAVHNYLRSGDTVILLHVRPTSVLYGADWGAIDVSLPDEDETQETKQKREEEFDLFTNKKMNDLALPLASFAKWPKVAAFLESLPTGSLILDAGCGNGKYLGLTPSCYFIGCDISAPLIKICADKGHEVLVADAVNLPYRTNFGDAAISIAVLHHLSTEDRRKKAIEELVRVVKKGGLVLITVWAVEQEDKSLLTKWTPLTEKYVEEWIGPGSPRVRGPSPFTLESIPETEENGSQAHAKDSNDSLTENMQQSMCLTPQNEDDVLVSKHGMSQQEYFVPWHLPYHRAEVSGASAGALANGLARKDDKKGAVVYDRYYHVFGEGELERLVSGMDNAVIVNKFYDKSNWCIILEKTL